MENKEKYSPPGGDLLPILLLVSFATSSHTRYGEASERNDIHDAAFLHEIRDRMPHVSIDAWLAPRTRGISRIAQAQWHANRHHLHTTGRETVPQAQKSFLDQIYSYLLRTTLKVARLDACKRYRRVKKDGEEEVAKARLCSLFHDVFFSRWPSSDQNFLYTHHAIYFKQDADNFSQQKEQ